MPAAIKIYKIRAVTETPEVPFLDCYDQTDANVVANLEVSKIMASLGLENPQPKKEVKMTDSRPLTSLPPYLDLQACMQLLNQINPEFETDTIEAARSSIDVASLDAALAKTELNVDDRMNLKAACVRHGILARGRPVNLARN